MGRLLDKIGSPDDIKKLNIQQLKELSEEIRSFLIENVSKTGGHLASNLGVVELSIAIHKVFNSPIDKIIWDVGHQSYVHKIITGRKHKFDTLRQFEGIAGFPRTHESEHDIFNTGHSSTSISAALGFARARDIKNEKYSVVAVIGDGALTGGMAFEALNDAGRSPNNLIVILNDNEMSITRNVGGLSGYLSRIRTQPIYYKAKEELDEFLNKIPAIGKSAVKALERAKGTIKYIITPGIIFEELGFKYLGPIDGHNISELNRVLSRAKLLKGPILIHVFTKKGKGYRFAEKRPQEYHGVSPFEIETGESITDKRPTFSDVFGKEICQLGEKDKNVVAISAAMTQGTGLEDFSKKFPKRFFDVGIAEQHAVTLAAGMARNGLKPVVAIYSSFLQRAYDQILHDVAMQKLHVVLAIDRAGLVGEDGETHQGLFDIAYLNHIPNMCILAPYDYSEFREMLEYAVLQHNGPIAIRYPRGTGIDSNQFTSHVEMGKGVLLREGKDITIAAIGNMVETAIKVSDRIEKHGYSVEVINARFVKPIDNKLILDSSKKTGNIITIEDGTVKGGFGSSVLDLINQSNPGCKIKVYGFPDKPIVHGSRQELIKKYRLDVDSLEKEILEVCIGKGKT